MIDKVSIIPFDKKYSKDFYKLNKEWLQTYFYVEPLDEDVLSQPEKYIINKGGYIFFVKLNDTIVGTYAFMSLKDKEGFELTKMAVLPEMRGQKIGQKLLNHAINFGKENKFKNLLLYSNRSLENAIYLYKKIGFKEVKLEPNTPYKRANIKMEFNMN
ncbi:GNAT family N-acetyltransferase [Olleya aquimaris]|uniref:Acetyltransferase (GNAT) family protein n=1 Tax=Olleya aquimaris TaxID=639310 RepID=A0A327RL48_9FLAO|nr:GNAT family N-acetyltransferase [Olleya aquimaris]RAJ16263.1 acetyltransferase (GNAT) family protein [Olleya aquimaris]